jgi:5-methylcytosine-specific restriction endonuclease McrA
VQQGKIDVAVFVLDRKGRPLMPCSEKRARKLLAAGRARVHRLFPFAVRLVDRMIDVAAFQPLRLALDPGSKATGLAISRIEEVTNADGVVEPVMHIRFLMALVHRGHAIKESLHARAAMRRRRRGNLRYRAPRFNNRTRPAGWLAPSLKHRVDTTMAWVKRLRRLAPMTHLAQELVRFDMQKMQNPEISGIQYQQGTLAGYELREYLLEKFNRCCAYCDAKDVPLQIEHIHAKANGGTNRVSNLTLACAPCNTKKAARDIRAFLAQDPARLARIVKQAQAPLRDAAAVNITRWALLSALKQTNAVGTAQRPETDQSAGRNRDRRADEMEPQPARHPQDACAGCGLRRNGAGCARQPRADLARQMYRPRLALQDAPGQVWLPARSPNAPEDSVWLSHRRHGGGERALRQAEGRAQGPGRYPADRQLQHSGRYCWRSDGARHFA